MISKIKMFAEKQWNDFCESGEYGDNVIGFWYKGMYIINPWMDESGRFELSTEEAKKKYGSKFNKFCKDVKEIIKK